MAYYLDPNQSKLVLGNLENVTITVMFISLKKMQLIIKHKNAYTNLYIYLYENIPMSYCCDLQMVSLKIESSK